MNRLLLAIIIFVASSVAIEVNAQSAQVSGIVLQENDGHILLRTNDNRRFPLRAATEEAAAALNKLHARDYLFGTGEFTDHGEVLLTTVDYVGLQGLVGRWKDQSGAILDFSNFKKVQIRAATSSQQIAFNYSISPADADGWKVFFSNNSVASLANLTLRERKAQLQFFDSNTGQPNAKIQMNKLDP